LNQEDSIEGDLMQIDRKHRLEGPSSHVSAIHGDVRTVEALALRREPPNSPDDDCRLMGRNHSADDVTRVVWEWWRISQSQFTYRESGVIDLGLIEE
jgi:hypothetical protein